MMQDSVSASSRITLAWKLKRFRVEDKRRAAYYRYYTGEEWRDIAGYDLSLDSEVLGEDGCVEFVQQVLSAFLK